LIQNELELIKDIKVLYNKKIILFGASSGGRRVKSHLKLIGIDIFGFCDNAESKWGKEIEGVRIYSIHELERNISKSEYVIIIASEYIHEITEQLKKSVLWEVPIYTGVAVEYGICFCTSYLSLEKKKKDIIEKGYQLWLQDKKHFLAMYNSDNRVSILDDQNPILIYHPGKVGSSSIYKSLKQQGLNVMQLCDLYYNIYGTENTEEKQFIFEHYLSTRNIKIISLVREPIARDISYYFQAAISDIENHIRGRISNDFVKECRQTLLDYSVNRKQGIDRINDWLDYIAVNGEHGTEFDWFDFEIKKLFGIDVYSKPFDREKGYCIIKKENIELLIIKMEFLNQMETVIKDFIGCESFELINDNVGELKSYSNMYKEMKQTITFPKEYMDFYYKNNKYMDWFYTEDEKKKYIEKWKNNVEL